MIKRWRVKWDETEVPDGEYVRAADYDALAAALWDLIDMLGRYPHPSEPPKLTAARRLVLPSAD